MKKTIVTLILLGCCLVKIYAQDMLGTWGSNYGGFSLAVQNPALIANSRLYADINLTGISLGYYHNDAYIEQPNNYVYQYLHLKKVGFPIQAAKSVYYSTHKPDFEKVFISVRELGPAFMLNDGRNAYALSFSVRQAVSITGIPDAIGSLSKNGKADLAMIAHGPYDINNPIRIAALAWGETAFSYARVLKSDTKDVMTVGVTLKYLTGISGGFLYIDKVGFTMLNKDLLSITKSSATTGFSLPYEYNDFKQKMAFDPGYQFGKGFGTDIGFSLQHNSGQQYTQRFNRLCEQEFEPYDYRFSAAIVDLGYIAFKDNAIRGTLVNTKPINYNINHFVYTNTNDALDTINLYFNPKDSSLVKRKFSVITPTAITFQYDKRITDHIYVMAGGIIGIPLGKNALARPSQLAIVPRYESDLFEVSLPLSMYDFKMPRLGLSARILFLTIGTDRLISLNGVHDYYGYDFYATIRLNFMKIFRLQYLKGQCRESITHPCF